MKIDIFKKSVIPYFFVVLALFFGAVVPILLHLNRMKNIVGYKRYKYGYIDNKGDYVIKPQFKFADSFSDGLAAVKRRDTYYLEFIDRSGKTIIPPSSDISYISEGPAPFYPRFPFNEGLHRFRSKGTFGFIGITGEVAIKPRYEWAYQFSEGLAAVEVNGKWGYINKEDHFVIEPQFEGAYDFSEGLAGIQINGKYGYIDREGKTIIEPKFDSAYNFSEGFAWVKVNDKWGLINQNGVFVIEPRFDDWISFFRDGRLIVATDNRWQVIDSNGTVVFENQQYHFCSESGFSDGMCVIKNAKDKYGFIDKDGNLTIDCKYDYAYAFSEGLAAVEVNRKDGYIDKTGRFVIKPQFKDAGPFSEGLANVGIYDE